MNFVEINTFNKNKMKNSLQNQENHFEWEDSSIMGYLLGNLPKIRDQYDEHDKIQEDIHTVEYYLEMHQSCLISGEGGIGKSYFIYKLEEELSKQRIKHLCVYGKYQLVYLKKL